MIQLKFEYGFKITKLFIDDGQGNFNTTYQAMADKVGQAQLTLYTCTDIDGENRLVIQADILDKRSLSSLHRVKQFELPTFSKVGSFFLGKSIV